MKKAVVAAQEVQNQKIELDQKLAERTAILQDVTKRIKKILASGGLGAALAMAKNGQFTQLTWARALLVAMRFPVTADNVAAVTAWEMAEGGHWQHRLFQPAEHHTEHAGRDGLPTRSASRPTPAGSRASRRP